MIKTILCVLFNDFPSSTVRGIGRTKYAEDLGVNWINFEFFDAKIGSPSDLVRKIAWYHKLRTNLIIKRKLKDLEKIILNKVDVILLINRPDQTILNYLEYFTPAEVIKIYDFDDPLYLDEFNMPKSFLDNLVKYDGICVDNEIEQRLVSNYNKNVLALPGITPVGKNLMKNNKEFKMIWVGSQSTSIYLTEYKDAFEQILKEFPKFEITFLGFDGSGLEILNERARYVPKYDEKDIINYCRDSDIGFYPSFDNQLGIERGPHKIHVYLSCGLPVIARDNVLNRQVLNAEYGFLHETVVEFKDIVRKLIIDVSLINELKASIRSSYDGDQLNKESTLRLINFFEIVSKK